MAAPRLSPDFMSEKDESPKRADSEDEGDVEGQRKRLRGIVTGHAYSVLQVHEAEGPLRLIELRAQPKPLMRLQL